MLGCFNFWVGFWPELPKMGYNKKIQTVAGLRHEISKFPELLKKDLVEIPGIN